MGEQKVWQAAWTLEPGPLQDEKVARALFLAVGDLIEIQPERYDLNRRGKWRPYQGDALVVDLLTQRTQLLVIEEKQSVEEGGHQVVIATGKQGPPPQAVALWKESWPPDEERLQAIEAAVARARTELPLATWSLRIGTGGDQLQVEIGDNKWDFPASWWREEERS